MYKMRLIRVETFVALCVLILGIDSVLSDEEHTNVLVKEKDAMAIAASEENKQMKLPEKEILETKDTKVPIESSSVQNDDENRSSPQEMEVNTTKSSMSEPQNIAAKEVMPSNMLMGDRIDRENEAEILAQPEMRRLARYLRNFHNRQILGSKTNALLARRAAAAVSDDDEDAIAEERAVRRRKRIRRIQTKDKVKRRNHNRDEANRNNTTRRNLKDRSSLRHKKSSSASQKQNKKNASIRRSPPRRQYDPYGLSENDRRGLRRGTPNRRPSGNRKPANNKNKKNKNKKNKNKKNKNKKNKNKKNKNKKNKNKNKKNKTDKNQMESSRPESNSNPEGDHQNESDFNEQLNFDGSTSF